ncbi:hypothetical protein AKJ41_02080 [candidate division MSBL1 archaeon SCGC-AAA259O05]|uniref:Uncharacterized protein n=1 Tax=candidate division MSBL1 archaeon SCGC-AAA259O05 TaxID=1698271 RepID=A0A133V4E6_9EURY|nr:hypothetical protein AKJ41_02080 [candidate division MSBL1 archaeon SCGC-AAA259O05]
MARQSVYNALIHTFLLENAFLVLRSSATADLEVSAGMMGIECFMIFFIGVSSSVKPISLLRTIPANLFSSLMGI